MTDLYCFNVRIPTDQFERLRNAAYQARCRPAELARSILLAGLESAPGANETPPPAPPTPASMAEASRKLLKLALASVSNLSQLADHALTLGPPLDRLAGPDGHLAQLSKRFREIGMDIKMGRLDEAAAVSLLVKLTTSTEKLNGLAKRLNIDRQSVGPTDWHTVLSSVTSALLK